jgi:hypothetical protein
MDKKSLQRKYKKHEIRHHKKVRLLLTLRESAVGQMTTCAGSVELRTGPHLNATGYNVSSAEYGTMKDMLEQVAERCIPVENITDPNSRCTDPIAQPFFIKLQSSQR